MAAGKSISDIEALCGFEPAIIRIMPNTPVSVGKGVILYTANGKTGAEALNGFLESLSGAGTLCRIDESDVIVLIC